MPFAALASGWKSIRPRARWAILAMLPLLLAGCARGSYAVELFPEQHYQPSYKRQEPPRLTPPDGAVPTTGRELTLSFEEANTTTNPMPESADALARGAEVYRVNCAMCHGPSGRGDGPVGAKLADNGYVYPPNLTAATTQNKSDGALFYVVTNGVVVMPKFGLLLNEEDRWLVVQYLRFLATPEAASPLATFPVSSLPGH